MMQAIRDEIADARYRELERKWRREDPQAYERLCALRSVYPHIEYTTNRQQMNRLMLLKWEFGKSKDQR